MIYLSLQYQNHNKVTIIMKKIIVAFAVFSALCLGSCKNSEELVPQDQAIKQDFSSVPSAVVLAVKTGYPAATDLSFSEIESAKVWEADFNLSTIPHEAKIDAKGNILEVYATAGAMGTDGVMGTITLPAAAEDYIKKNYAGYKVVSSGEGEYNKQKAYKVLLRTEKEEVTIIFDEKGNVVIEFKASSQLSTRPDPPKTYPLVKAEELTEAIAKYLKDNGLTFAKGIATVVDNTKKTYFIVATKGTTTFELYFDNDGKLTKSSSYTPPPAPVAIKAISELPAEAVKYLAGYVLVSGTATTDRNGKKTYVVYVTKEGKKFEISFDNEGKLIRSTFITPAPQVLKASELPETISKYLKENGQAFEKGTLYYDKEGKKFFDVVAVKAGVITIFTFDADGKVIRKSVTPPAPQEIKAATELPDAIAKYLKDNGLTFVKGTIIFDADSKKSYVISAKKEKESHELYFDSNGKLLKSVILPALPKIEEKALVGTDLPKIISEYLNNTYKTWTFMKGYQVLTDGKSTSYLVVIKVNTDLYYVYFNGEGKFEVAKKG